jgi:hypothetical protein
VQPPLAFSSFFAYENLTGGGSFFKRADVYYMSAYPPVSIKTFLEFLPATESAGIPRFKPSNIRSGSPPEILFFSLKYARFEETQ